MSTLPKSRLRIAGDLFRFNRLVDLLRPSLVNQFEEETPLVPRFHGADSLQIEVAVFNDGVLLTDLSAIAELELVIKPLSTTDAVPIDFDDPNPDALRGPASNVAPIICKRIGSEHFNTSLTDGQWQSKAADKAHAILTLDSAEAALAPGERWLSLIALGADGQARTLAAGPVLILGGGPTFNALPQPVVKDLRDQAAQSAAQAQHSANDAATSAQQAANAALAAQEQVTLATAAVTQADAAKTGALQAATLAEEARDSASQHSASAQAAAQAAQQSAAAIGNLDNALAQAQANAEHSQTAATEAAASALAAAAYAAALNPAAKESTGGIYKSVSAAVRLEAPIALGTGEFDIFIMASCVPRTDSSGDCLLGVTEYSSGLLVMRRSDGLWYVRDASNNLLPITWAHRITDAALVRLCRDANTLSLYIDGELVGSTDVTGVTFGTLAYLGSRTAAGTDFGWYGTLRSLSVYNRILSPDEAAQLLSSGGQIIPVSARSSCVLNLPMDDGAGYQFRDHSGNANHALLSASGCTHLKPGQRFEFSWARVSSGFLGDADRPVLPDNAVIESVIWEDAKATKTTVSLGYNASNLATHVASFTPAQSRQSAALAAGSLSAADRRLYLHMSANAGAVTVRVTGRIL